MSTGTVTGSTSTITAGGTAQALFVENAGRRGWMVQNLSTADLFVNDLAAAALDTGFKIPAGAILDSTDYPARDAISIWGATTGQKFTAREF